MNIYNTMHMISTAEVALFTYLTNIKHEHIQPDECDKHGKSGVIHIPNKQQT